MRKTPTSTIHNIYLTWQSIQCVITHITGCMVNTQLLCSPTVFKHTTHWLYLYHLLSSSVSIHCSPTDIILTLHLFIKQSLLCLITLKFVNIHFNFVYHLFVNKLIRRKFIFVDPSRKFIYTHCSSPQLWTSTYLFLIFPIFYITSIQLQKLCELSTMKNGENKMRQ